MDRCSRKQLRIVFCPLVARCTEPAFACVPFQMQALVHLDLSYNNLTCLPDSITSLRSLEHLLLRGNQLAGVSEEVGNLTSLRRLDLRRNKLTQLPTSITSLDKLEELDLSENLLTELPHDIGKLCSLIRLNASFNEITCIPESIKSCEQVSLPPHRPVPRKSIPFGNRSPPKSHQCAQANHKFFLLNDFITPPQRSNLLLTACVRSWWSQHMK